MLAFDASQSEIMSNEHQELYERLKDRRSMMDAEQELLEMGPDAVPLLEAIFSGEARNQFGVPYRRLGLPLECALETACRMGPTAKPLEKRIREELKQGVYRAAAMALRKLAPLEDESVVALANAMGNDGNLDLSFEAALILMQLGHSTHAAVQRCLAEKPAAAKVWEKVSSWQGRASDDRPSPSN